MRLSQNSFFEVNPKKVFYLTFRGEFNFETASD